MKALPVSLPEPAQVVWFKRDLRVRDHAPLAAAAARGPVLPLYIVEPALLAAPDFAPRPLVVSRRVPPRAARRSRPPRPAPHCPRRRASGGA